MIESRRLPRLILYDEDIEEEQAYEKYVNDKNKDYFIIWTERGWTWCLDFSKVADLYILW